MTLLNKIIFGVTAALLLITGGAVVWLLLVNAHVKMELAQAQADDGICRLANGDFADKVVRQNAAVAQMEQASVAQSKQAQVREAAARKAKIFYEKRAREIAAWQEKGDACKAADKLFDDYLAGIK
ncbi:MAG: hypothetical protein KGI97_03470 [Alphaproteobacteria bacterium]|nr:hypothetical protein [Alphaproteobacteria bacterium]